MPSAPPPPPPDALTFRQKVYGLLDPQDSSGPAEQLFNRLLALLILLNVTVMVLSTVPSIQHEYGRAIRIFDLFCGVVFGLEYLGRLYTAPLRPGAPPGARAYLHYALQPLPLIDLTVVVTLILPGSSALASLRLFKLLSLLRLGRYSTSLQLIGRVISQRSSELFATFLIAAVLVLIAASVLYQAESAAGTPGFGSIPEALWWATVTLTTTGYGDVFPETPLGKLAAGVIMLFSIGMVALPAGMVASSFAEELDQQRAKEAAEAEVQEEEERAASYRYCPHCGERLP
ncbi:ion transporter [Deinococcus sp. Marseille-Q6407]|uniref:ion transporter n=1 Tax=Deinococcus sp. Marseille-Q6407 TaxID=2969223 RepID=UPI0021BF3612|nr:ion transporter [Deinococcus sp. Marseille-Q6407]